MTLVDVNYLGVLLAAVSSMVVGFTWYGPLLGKAWMAASGMTKEKMEKAKKDVNRLYAISFIAALVTAYVLAQFIKHTGATTTIAGIRVGFFAWFGFVATSMLGSTLFGGKPFKLYALDSGYQLASLIVMGVILVWLG